MNSSLRPSSSSDRRHVLSPYINSYFLFFAVVVVAVVVVIHVRVMYFVPEIHTSASPHITDGEGEKRVRIRVREKEREGERA